MIPIIDMHCDTIYKIYELRRKGQDVELRSNNLHMDLMRCQRRALRPRRLRRSFGAM